MWIYQGKSVLIPMHVKSWCLIRRSFYNFSSLEFLKGYNEGEDLHFLFYLIETIISKDGDQFFFKKENSHLTRQVRSGSYKSAEGASTTQPTLTNDRVLSLGVILK